MSAGFFGRAGFLLGRAFVSFGLGARGMASNVVVSDARIHTSTTTVTTIAVKLREVTRIDACPSTTTTITVSLREHG